MVKNERKSCCSMGTFKIDEDFLSKCEKYSDLKNLSGLHILASLRFPCKHMGIALKYDFMKL